ncbi:DNA/RNA polymerase, partial [Armillaria gallica]
EHLQHVDQVLNTISSSGITLSLPKCHFAYCSLLLLGQKVSRLGMSTHREKVEAICMLKTLRNTHELQTFLGMMVYFSGYIPFYAWMAHPLFQLLKKDTKWTWTTLHDEAFELCKQVLMNAPV